MATYNHSHLPPSPPPSPPRRRQHKKKQSDPFQDWDTPLPSPPASVQADGQEQDSSLVRTILTPLYFISFLLSLFLVNREDRRRRSASQSKTSIFNFLSPSAWLDPEPYQDPDNSTWERRASTTHAEPPPSLNPELEKTRRMKSKKKGWFLHKKIRKVAKLEINDAFEMRGRVIVLMVSIWIMLIAGILMGVKWLLQSI